MAAATAATDDADAAASVAALAAASAGRCGLADGVGGAGKLLGGLVSQDSGMSSAERETAAETVTLATMEIVAGHFAGKNGCHCIRGILVSVSGARNDRGGEWGMAMSCGLLDNPRQLAGTFHSATWPCGAVFCMNSL